MGYNEKKIFSPDGTLPLAYSHNFSFSALIALREITVENHT